MHLHRRTQQMHTAQLHKEAQQSPEDLYSKIVHIATQQAHPHLVFLPLESANDGLCDMLSQSPELAVVQLASAEDLMYPNLFYQKAARPSLHARVSFSMHNKYNNIGVVTITRATNQDITLYIPMTQRPKMIAPSLSHETAVCQAIALFAVMSESALAPFL